MRAELHAHSTASDGTYTPEALVAHALDLGLDVLALTDHDTVEGIQAALQAADGTPLNVIAGVELSAVHEDRDVHILGYFVDPHDEHLLEHLASLRAARLRRAEAIVEALAQAGYGIGIDDVLALTDGAVGRSHVARALVEAGHAETVGDAFARLLGRGRPFYLGKDVNDPIEVVGVVLEAGAVPVLAHPGVTGVESAVPALVDAGLAGIEAYHAEHTAEQAAHFDSLARSMGLLVTGGSDFHGLPRPAAELGSVRLPDGAVEALLAAGGHAARP